MDLSEKRLWGDQEAIRLSADRAGLLRRQCRSHPAALVADDLFHALEPSETGEIWNCTN
jgi:hypothetical protein